MPAIFELKCNDEKQFYFHYLNSNSEIIMMSGDYDNKEEAEQGIKETRVGSLMG